MNRPLRPTEIEDSRIKMGNRPTTIADDIKRAQQREQWDEQHLTRLLRYDIDS